MGKFCRKMVMLCNMRNYL